jgi:hypothetical protein
MNRAVHRTFLLEYFVSALRGRHFLTWDALQLENDVDAAKHENALFNLDIAVGRRCKLTTARSDVARLQRAPKGAKQSTTSGGNDVVERCRMRLRHVTFDSVVTRNRAVCSKPYGLCLGRQLREPERALDSRQRDLRSIDHFTHRSSFMQDGSYRLHVLG